MNFTDAVDWSDHQRASKCNRCDAGYPSPCTQPGCEGLIHAVTLYDCPTTGGCYCGATRCDVCNEPEA